MSPDNIASSSVDSWEQISIAFDFDGTLVDCKVRQVEVLRSVIRRKEFSSIVVNFDEWWNLKRDGLNTCNALIKIGVKPPIAETITKCWIELIEEPQWLDLDCLKPDALSFLQFLKSKKNKLYLLTARKSGFCLLNQLNELALLPYFDQYYIVDPLETVAKKKEILNRNKLLIFFGDSENDYLASVSTTAKFIGVSSGQRSPKFLKSVGVKRIIKNFSKV